MKVNEAEEGVEEEVDADGEGKDGLMNEEEKEE